MSVYLSVTHRNEEAAKKWCPFAWSRSNTHDGNSLPPHRQCLTSGCMAWIDETDHVYDIAMGRCGLVTA